MTGTHSDEGFSEIERLLNGAEAHEPTRLSVVGATPKNRHTNLRLLAVAGIGVALVLYLVPETAIKVDHKLAEGFSTIGRSAMDIGLRHPHIVRPKADGTTTPARTGDL